MKIKKGRVTRMMIRILPGLEIRTGLDLLFSFFPLSMLGGILFVMIKFWFDPSGVHITPGFGHFFWFMGALFNSVFLIFVTVTGLKSIELVD